jgi:hypothetical protein
LIIEAQTHSPERRLNAGRRWIISDQQIRDPQRMRIQRTA